MFFWPEKTLCLPIIPSYITQGRLRYTQVILACRFIPQAIMRRMVPSYHKLGPPRKEGQRPHAIADRPQSLTLSIDPRLGVESQHQELHRCALWQIFRPAFKISRLTRILHHSISVNIIITH